MSLFGTRSLSSTSLTFSTLSRNATRILWVTKQSMDPDESRPVDSWTGMGGGMDSQYKLLSELLSDQAAFITSPKTSLANYGRALPPLAPQCLQAWTEVNFDLHLESVREKGPLYCTHAIMDELYERWLLKETEKMKYRPKDCQKGDEPNIKQ